MISTIEKKISEFGFVKIKLYSLEYIIEKNSIGLCIYPLNSSRKNYYGSLEDLFKEFKVYNENLIDNIDLISIVS